MARHDLECSDCGSVYPDVVVPADLGARAFCLGATCHCGGRFVPLPAIRLSLFGDGMGASGPGRGDGDFTKFVLPVEDPGSPTGYREETIGSLADIRRLERESEQRERDGLGRRMVWREYSQDASNRDVHTIAPDFVQPAPAKTLPSHGQPITHRRGDPVIAAHGTVEQAEAAGV